MAGVSVAVGSEAAVAEYAGRGVSGYVMPTKFEVVLRDGQFIVRGVSQGVESIQVNFSDGTFDTLTATVVPVTQSPVATSEALTDVTAPEGGVFAVTPYALTRKIGTRFGQVVAGSGLSVVALRDRAVFVSVANGAQNATLWCDVEGHDGSVDTYAVSVHVAPVMRPHAGTPIATYTVNWSGVREDIPPSTITPGGVEYLDGDGLIGMTGVTWQLDPGLLSITGVDPATDVTGHVTTRLSNGRVVDVPVRVIAP